MARKDQPYLPLYVQDFMTDEKLRECSAESVGVYIFLMCLMHKSDEYGKIILTDKYFCLSKSSSKIQAGASDFASMFVKHLPFSHEVIERSLEELLHEKVIHIEGNVLIQKRMVRDAQISTVRAYAGKKGGKNRLKNDDIFAQAKVQANSQAKVQANTEIEIEIENNNDNKIKHKYGLYDNVLLTDKEYENLKSKYFNIDGIIEWFSSYIVEKGYKSKSHNLAIQRWVADAVNKNNKLGVDLSKKDDYNSKLREVKKGAYQL